MTKGKFLSAVQLLALLAISLGLLSGCASGPPPVPRLQVAATGYEADFDRTWNAVNDVLSEQRLPIKAIEKDSGLVTTEFVNSGGRYIYWGKKDGAGQQVSTWADKTRYFLNIRVRDRKGGGTTVDVLPHVEYMRYEYNATLKRTVEAGWEACESHGDIENSIYDALSAKLSK